MKRPYTKPGRLADVLALIQVLALDEHAHRSGDGMDNELQAEPVSSDSWIGVAQEHPEFFRIREEGKHTLSLVSRHVLPNNEMPPGLIQSLLEVAIDLHDRQVAAAESWKTWIPVLSALAGAVVASVTTIFALWLNGWCKP